MHIKRHVHLQSGLNQHLYKLVTPKKREIDWLQFVKQCRNEENLAVEKGFQEAIKAIIKTNTPAFWHRAENINGNWIEYEKLVLCIFVLFFYNLQSTSCFQTEMNRKCLSVNMNENVKEGGQINWVNLHLIFIEKGFLNSLKLCEEKLTTLIQCQHRQHGHKEGEGQYKKRTELVSVIPFVVSNPVETHTDIEV